MCHAACAPTLPVPPVPCSSSAGATSSRDISQPIYRPHPSPSPLLSCAPARYVTRSRCALGASLLGPLLVPESSGCCHPPPRSSQLPPTASIQAGPRAGKENVSHSLSSQQAASKYNSQRPGSQGHGGGVSNPPAEDKAGVRARGSPYKQKELKGGGSWEWSQTSSLNERHALGKINK